MELTGLIHGTAHVEPGRPLHIAEALLLGYRVIDCGPTPAYDEDAVGRDLNIALQDASIPRSSITLQTKYSPAAFFARAPELCPYAPGDAVPRQVLASIARSLRRLRTPFFDVYLLHRPLPTLARTFAAWEVMEEITRRGGARRLGVSQVDAPTLAALWERAAVRPACVQNAFGSRADGFDAEVRAFCAAHDIAYQAFGVLRAAEREGLLELPRVVAYAAAHAVSRASALFALLVAWAASNSENFAVLDGSKDPQHMRENRKALKGVGEIPQSELQEFGLSLLGTDAPSKDPTSAPKAGHHTNGSGSAGDA